MKKIIAVIFSSLLTLGCFAENDKVTENVVNKLASAENTKVTSNVVSKLASAVTNGALLSNIVAANNANFFLQGLGPGPGLGKQGGGGGGGTDPSTIMGYGWGFEADLNLNCSGACSNGSDLTTITDHSGNGNTATCSNAAGINPKYVAAGSSGFSNSKPAAIFDSSGGSNCILGSYVGDNKFNITTMMLVKIPSSPGCGGCMILGSDDGGLGYFPNQAIEVRTTGLTTGVSGVPADDTWHVFGFSGCGMNGSGANTGQYILDLVSNGTPTPTTFDIYSGIHVIGAIRAGQYDNFNGYMAAAADFPGVCLNLATMQSIAQFWKSKYGF